MPRNENDVFGALSGFGLGAVLGDLDLPSGSGLAGVPGADFQDWDEEGAVGRGEGDDWEDEVNAELAAEHASDYPLGLDLGLVKTEARSPEPELFRMKERRVRVVRKLVERPKTVYERFPAFQKDQILNFSELFRGAAVKKSRISKRQFQVETWFPRRRDVPRNFLDSVVGDSQRQKRSKAVADVVAASSVEDELSRTLNDTMITVPSATALNDRSFDLVVLSNWEDQIVFGPSSSSTSSAPPAAAQGGLTQPVNKALESGAWAQSIIWDKHTPFRDFTQIEFNHEDDIIPQTRPSADGMRPRKRLKADAVKTIDKFNLSNDAHYELSVKEGARQRVRQTFGQITVEHAHPAQKLQLPFYKTRISKQEARSWHRPAMQFPTNVELRFSKVRTAKKKKDKAGRKLGRGGNVGEGLHRTADLSLADTSNFILWELSEELPPIMSSLGMGSVLVNYYRKKTDMDDHIPKYDLGVPFVLDPTDDSPFMRFGNVNPGQTIPTLYNNLIRAPLFRQKAYHTDFLVVRSSTRGETHYFLREIKNLFVAGQTYPVTEVPGPHSRKITNTVKHRLQIIACKILSKSPGERLKISRLMKYFPDQNELQMRQRLKEFMEYHRRGPHQGFWRLKTTWNVPTPAEMLKLVTPEQVVLMESMQVGQRHLQDLGYSGGVDGGAEGGDESHLTVEQQLAPWITTKNFLLATQAKAMLRLHGEGDPSGRGEAFSMLRVSMKDIFVKAGEDYEQKLAEAEARPKSAHKYNVAEQQQIYRSEVDRIWKAQYDSLARKDEPQLSDHEDDRPSTQPQSSMSSNRYDSPAAFSRASTMEPDLGPESQRRVLRIQRLVDDEWKTEIVRDASVIAAYVRKRQNLEEENTLADTLAPTGDIDRDSRAKKRLEEEIARMKKNQERRLHRKNAKIVKEGGLPMTLDRPLKPDTTRRCGHCGQMGHMKTNRKCPRWAEFNSPNAPPPLTPASGGSSSGAYGGAFVASPMDGAASPSVAGRPSAYAPSPLAMSPPVSAMDVEEGSSGGPSAAPKLKLTLGKRS